MDTNLYLINISLRLIYLLNVSNKPVYGCHSHYDKLCHFVV